MGFVGLPDVGSWVRFRDDDGCITVATVRALCVDYMHVAFDVKDADGDQTWALGEWEDALERSIASSIIPGPKGPTVLVWDGSLNHYETPYTSNEPDATALIVEHDGKTYRASEVDVDCEHTGKAFCSPSLWMVHLWIQAKEN